MDLEAAKQTSREGFADARVSLRELLGDLDPRDRADVDQVATAIRVTLQANSIPLNGDTARAFVMAVAMVGVELMKHHGNTYPDELPCLEAHHLRCELAAEAVLVALEEP